MKTEEIHSYFDQFAEKKILIIGDVMIDAYLWGNVNRISPEAPVPIVACKKREDRLGGAANVARNIQSLGAEPILCSVIGKDEKGKIFTDILQKRNMTQIGIMQSSQRSTTVKTRVISQNQQLLRVDEEMNKALDTDIETEFIQLLYQIINSQAIDAIIFEDYDKGVITKNLIHQVVELATSLKIPTLVDPKKRNFAFYKEVTFFKPNFKELTEGIKIEIAKNDLERIAQLSIDFQTKQNIRYVMTTLSEYGVLVSDNEKYLHYPAEIRDIADVSGAGDTVISIAALCMSVGLSMSETAQIANLGGGLVCEKVGVVPIDKSLLLNETINYFQHV